MNTPEVRKVPKEIQDKIDEKFPFNKSVPPAIKSQHFLAKEFQKEGAIFGYSLALEQLEEKERSYKALEVIYNIELNANENCRKEIERLKGLVQQQWNNYHLYMKTKKRLDEWDNFKITNNE
jgi:hypothetical protein